MLVASAFAGSVNADVLYSNGTVDGNTNAFDISSGYVVADTFSLSAASNLSGVTFDSWDAYANDVTAVDWTIFSGSGTGATGPTGTVVASGVQSLITSTTSLLTNSQFYVVEANTFTLANLNLAAGTYWLELANATTTSGADVYWDVNSTGSSLAWSNAPGTIGAVSNSFQVTGAAVPLPGAAWMFASALAGLGAIRRMARKA